MIAFGGEDGMWMASCASTLQALHADTVCQQLVLCRHSNQPCLGCLNGHLVNTHVCFVLLHVNEVWPEEWPALPQEAPLCNMDRRACQVSCEYFIQVYT